MLSYFYIVPFGATHKSTHLRICLVTLDQQQHSTPLHLESLTPREHLVFDNTDPYGVSY